MSSNSAEELVNSRDLEREKIEKTAEKGESLLSHYLSLLEVWVKHLYWVSV